jgi:hypothetical protein
MMDAETAKRRLAVFETVNTVFWVSLDVSWFFQLKPACAVFAVPTIFTCLAVFRYTDRTATSLFVSGAVAFWACFNVFWVLGDLKMLSWGLPAAKVFIALLAASLLGAIVAAASDKDAREVVLHRLRRFRIGDKA